MNYSKFARNIQQIAAQMLDEDKAGDFPLRHAGLCFNFTDRLENSFGYNYFTASTAYDLMCYCIGWKNYAGLGESKDFNEARREVCRIICASSIRTLRRYVAIAHKKGAKQMIDKPALKAFKHIKPE